MCGGMGAAVLGGAITPPILALEGLFRTDSLTMSDCWHFRVIIDFLMFFQHS